MRNAERPTFHGPTFNRNPQSANPLLFGIVQGGTFEDLRRASAEATVQIGFDGYAIGGVSVGEPEPEMMQAVEWSEPFLPNDKPRYAMGLGTPPQLLELIARGVDMFDCVLPTRLARNGTAFTSQGTLNLKNAEFALQKGPLEEGCVCPACRDFTRGYIRHLDQSRRNSRPASDHAPQSAFLSEPDAARPGRNRKCSLRYLPPALCRWIPSQQQPRPRWGLSEPTRGQGEILTCLRNRAGPLLAKILSRTASAFCGPRYLSPS